MSKRIHLTQVALPSGVMALTDAQLSFLVSMSLNARRTHRSLEQALLDGGSLEGVARGVSKRNTCPENAWLLANLHALTEGDSRPDLAIENEYHQALIDDAWAIHAANEADYDADPEDPAASNPSLDRLIATMENLGGANLLGTSQKVFMLLEREHRRYRGEKKLDALSHALGVELQLRLRIWAASEELEETEFHQILRLLREREHCFYVLGRPRELARTLVQTAAVPAETNQFRDSVVHFHRAVIQAEREGLPDWECQAYIVKQKVDQQLSKLDEVQESQREIHRILSANADAPWTVDVRRAL